jgi:hypothetical protein
LFHFIAFFQYFSRLALLKPISLYQTRGEMFKGTIKVAISCLLLFRSQFARNRFQPGQALNGQLLPNMG